jgi:hypothetical protein
MGKEFPNKVMLGQTLVLMQMTFLNNVRKVDRLVLSRTSCFMLFLDLLRHLWILFLFCTVCCSSAWLQLASSDAQINKLLLLLLLLSSFWKRLVT